MISVIVPVYNVEKYLPDCLDSILSQTYTDFEIVMVDDGSTDHSGVICDDYCKRDRRCKVIHQTNKGLAGARNTGLENKKGDYFCFIDSDDCIAPSFLELMVVEAEKTGANIVQVNFEYVGEEFTDYKKDIQKTFERYELPMYQSLYCLEGKTIGNLKKEFQLIVTIVCNKLYRSEKFKDFKFDETVKIHEDQMAIHQLLIMGDGITYLDIPLYYYRYNSSSIMHKRWSIKRLSMLDCYENRLLWCEKLKNRNDDQSEKMIDFMYNRYLICIVRKYNEVYQNMTGEDRKKECTKILKRMKALLKSKRGKIRIINKVAYFAFLHAPQVGIMALSAWDKNKRYLHR